MSSLTPSSEPVCPGSLQIDGQSNPALLCRINAAILLLSLGATIAVHPVVPISVLMTFISRHSQQRFAIALLSAIKEGVQPWLHRRRFQPVMMYLASGS